MSSNPTRPIPNPMLVDRPGIVKALLAFAEERGPSKDFETLKRLIASDPFAFLTALLFNQGMKAERVWAVPDELRQRLRLERLDPARLLDLAVVERAVKEPLPLHRYVNTLPKWIVAAARRVMSEY